MCCGQYGDDLETSIMGSETGERASKADRDEKHYLRGNWWEYIVTHLSVEKQFRTWVCDDVGLAVRASKLDGA